MDLVCEYTPSQSVRPSQKRSYDCEVRNASSSPMKEPTTSCGKSGIALASTNCATCVGRSPCRASKNTAAMIVALSVVIYR
eukprot:2053602-Prymnesium_polylepis.1